MIGVLRAVLVAVLAAIIFSVVFAPRAAHRALDPDEPIAADGSMIAGRTLTIYDTNPLLGATGGPRPDSDDPRDFEDALKNDQKWAERERGMIKNLLGPLDWSRCADSSRRLLISAVHGYYGARGREISSFSRRGPRAKAAIEAAWSSPLDRQIDDFVRHAVQYGILHKDEMPANVYPEFASVTADITELGAGCTAANR
jgi:hypothetical protein